MLNVLLIVFVFLCIVSVIANTGAYKKLERFKFKSQKDDKDTD